MSFSMCVYLVTDLIAVWILNNDTKCFKKLGVDIATPIVKSPNKMIYPTSLQVNLVEF